MVKVIEGDLILTENTEFSEGIKVKGDIKGKDYKRFNLKVAGDINAWDIDAWEIIIEKRIKKTESSKTRARIFIENKSKMERKEW